MPYSCDKCNKLFWDSKNVREDDYGEVICALCDANEAEAVYDRQQERELESPPETSREAHLRTWREHQEAHKR